MSKDSDRNAANGACQMPFIGRDRFYDWNNHTASENKDGSFAVTPICWILA